MYYFKCLKEHGLYKVKKETFMKFIEGSEKKKELKKKTKENDEFDVIAIFKDECPRCSTKGESAVQIKIRTPKAPYKKM